MDTFVPDLEYRPDAYDPSDVMEQVLRVASGLRDGAVVAFHGWPGSGKTPSARWLGRSLNAPVICLDNIRHVQPDGAERGFDEASMIRVVAQARSSEAVIIVDGVCACRVCVPDVLVTVGRWPGGKLSKSLTNFIGGYDPFQWQGRVETLHATFNRQTI